MPIITVPSGKWQLCGDDQDSCLFLLQGPRYSHLNYVSYPNSYLELLGHQEFWCGQAQEGIKATAQQDGQDGGEITKNLAHLVSRGHSLRFWLLLSSTPFPVGWAPPSILSRSKAVCLTLDEKKRLDLTR